MVKEGVVDANSVINEIAAIKRHQVTISADLQTLQRDNQLVWQETAQLQTNYHLQQQTINKMVSFLATVFSKKKDVSNVSSSQAENKKRKLMIEEASETEDERADHISAEDISSLFEIPSPPSAISASLSNLQHSIIPQMNILPNQISPLEQPANLLNPLAFGQPFYPSNSSQPLNQPQNAPNTSQLSNQQLCASLFPIAPAGTANPIAMQPISNDPTLPLSQDMDILNDRLDSLSYLMDNYTHPTQWSPQDLQNANLQILHDTDEGKTLLANMNEGTSMMGLEEPVDVSQVDFDEFFN